MYKLKQINKINEMKLVDGYWTDNNGNKWVAHCYDKEEAERLSLTLENCDNCINSRECTDCTLCKRCVRCNNCKDCYNCSGLINCDYLECCNYICNASGYVCQPEVYTSFRCGSRRGITYIYCGKTRTKEKDIQVCCGCFRGDLEEFEAKVIENYGINENDEYEEAILKNSKSLKIEKYFNDYMKIIKKVKILFDVE